MTEVLSVFYKYNFPYHLTDSYLHERPLFGIFIFCLMDFSHNKSSFKVMKYFQTLLLLYLLSWSDILNLSCHFNNLHTVIESIFYLRKPPIIPARVCGALLGAQPRSTYGLSTFSITRLVYTISQKSNFFLFSSTRSNISFINILSQDSSNSAIFWTLILTLFLAIAARSIATFFH